MHYKDVLETKNILSLNDRRQKITTKLFNNIASNSHHNLYDLLPPLNIDDHFLRNHRNVELPVCKTNRLNDVLSCTILIYILDNRFDFFFKYF